MVAIKQAASEFLADRRIAVTGVSRDPKGHGANVVYRRLEDRGYDVVAINPHADRVEGDECYPDLKSVPGGVQAVVIGTRPDAAETAVHERRPRCRPGLDAPRAGWRERVRGRDGLWARTRPHRDRRWLPVHVGPTADAGHKVMRWGTETPCSSSWKNADQDLSLRDRLAGELVCTALDSAADGTRSARGRTDRDLVPRPFGP